MAIYVVRAGDSLAAISREYGVSVARLIADNGLSRPESLVVGQALLILPAEVVHTVSAGETLSGIASAYGTDFITLLQKNPFLLNQPVLYPGEQIVITFEGEGSAPLSSLGYAYEYIDPGIFKSALPTLSKAALFSYGFTAEGSLIPLDDQALIAAAYAYRTAPVLLLSAIDADGSFTSGLSSRLFNEPVLQEKVIASMLETMQAKGYLGADIDFEYVPAEDRAAYTAFVQNVSAELNAAGFFVNVDLAPKISDDQPGTLYEGHDYAALGEAANTVLIMTYEWGYTFGPPLAVAPLPEVRRVVEYAVSKIEPFKIYMGIPNYGYDWRLPFVRGESRAVSLGNEEAVRLAAANNAAIQYDEQSQSPFFEYRAADGSEHIVWFEDIRSIEQKYKLIEEFDLLGSGYWNLMRPFAQNWLYLAYRYQISKIVPW